jgi:hypothetical protein
MKNTRKFRIFTVIASVVICAVIAFSLVGCQPQPGTDAYDYPVKPGTPQWAAFATHDDMLAACQIPAARLHSMSTQGLVTSVLNYPLYLDYMAYTWSQQGFDAVHNGFNGIDELFSRKDAGTVLLANYKAFDPAAFGQDWTDLQKGQHVFKLQGMEMLLAQEPIIASLTSQQCRDLVQECISKLNAEANQVIVYGMMGRASTSWIVARVLEQIKYQPFLQQAGADVNYQDFVTKGGFAADDVLIGVFKQGQDFLVEKAS